MPFLTSPLLEESEKSLYERPELSGESGTVLEHCRRAVSLVLARGVGPHGLLKIGGGDWNDSFDAMGDRAESVWLTWFASVVCLRLSERLGPPDGLERMKYAEMSRVLGLSANEAWAEDRYLRGWYADGTPLGAPSGRACRVDSVAQSFAAFCPWADRDRVRTALDTALRELWDRENHLIRLFDPPFGPEGPSPGYVTTYGPGFRENGGQYTHAAVWLARALFRTGRWRDGHELLLDLVRSLRREGFLAEPYVLSADVYAAPAPTGRAGWSWYTGAAGWWFRVAWEDMLGFSLRDGKGSVDLPEEAKVLGWGAEYLPPPEEK